MRLLDHLIQTAGLEDAAREEILRLMGAPERTYHGCGHLGTLWARHRKFAPGTEFAGADAARLIACAIAFHDAIYEPLRRDNETRSAALWRAAAPPDLTAEQVDWVAVTIEATADHLAWTDTGSAAARLRLWMLDLDLTPLGERPVVFARNTNALRREFAALGETEWRRGRAVFFRHLLAAPQIFRSPPLAAAFEQQARRNITGVLRTA